MENKTLIGELNEDFKHLPTAERKMYVNELLLTLYPAIVLRMKEFLDKGEISKDEFIERVVTHAQHLDDADTQGIATGARLAFDGRIVPKHVEIERRFLLLDHPNLNPEKEFFIQQMYLLDKPFVLRVRTSENLDDRTVTSYLTLKGKAKGAECPEYECRIPNFIGKFFVWAARRKIKKVRQYVNYEGHTWHVDHFHGDNEGLCQAEIELKSNDEQFSLPPWVGREVTDDSRYRNSNLLKRPFKTW